MSLSEDLLADLVAFPTVSRESNLDLIAYVKDFLAAHGVAAQVLPNEDGRKASLYASIGPADVPGLVLSGHTDVVPVKDQRWSHDPFKAVGRAGRIYGRGTADMKGFLACVLALVPTLMKKPLSRPVHLAFSYDEEIGCVGVRPLLEVLREKIPVPALCLIGEPTSMQVALAHKGKIAATCRCVGLEAHSAHPHEGLNAIYLANDMIAALRKLQHDMMAPNERDSETIDPRTTIHVGRMEGGTALNIVPRECRFEFEIRSPVPTDGGQFVGRLEEAAESIVQVQRHAFPNTQITLDITNAYPALQPCPDEPAVKLAAALAGGGIRDDVSFGTEAGLFQAAFGAPTIICGPGSMEQGHKADEFVPTTDLAKCEAFLSALAARL